MVSLAHSLYQEALPSLQLWDLLLGRSVGLRVMEDNQAMILVVRKGYSPKLRHIIRTHRVNLSGLSEVFRDDSATLEYCATDNQAADIFTGGSQNTTTPLPPYVQYLCILLSSHTAVVSVALSPTIEVVVQSFNFSFKSFISP